MLAARLSDVAEGMNEPRQEPTPEEIEKVIAWFTNDPAWIAWPFLKMQVGTLIAALRSSQAKLEESKRGEEAATLIATRERLRAEEAEAKLARADKMEAAWHAKVLRLQGELVEAKKDLESGFMQGAYARLKNLQEAEKERDSLAEKMKEAMKREKALDGVVAHWVERVNVLESMVVQMRTQRDALAGRLAEAEKAIARWKDEEQWWQTELAKEKKRADRLGEFALLIESVLAYLGGKEASGNILHRAWEGKARKALEEYRGDK